MNITYVLTWRIGAMKVESIIVLYYIIWLIVYASYYICVIFEQTIVFALLIGCRIWSIQRLLWWKPINAFGVITTSFLVWN